VPRLFTYTTRVDDGAAPNPFRGMCSLAICKPGIRRVAKKGDWVVGLGSKNAHSGDLSNRLVYAMRVEDVLSLEAYDRQAPTNWPIAAVTLSDSPTTCFPFVTRPKGTRAILTRPILTDLSLGCAGYILHPVRYTGGLISSLTGLPFRLAAVVSFAS
jgi:hypothetical protein